MSAAPIILERPNSSGATADGLWVAYVDGHKGALLGFGETARDAGDALIEDTQILLAALLACAAPQLDLTLIINGLRAQVVAAIEREGHA